jgi:hypothetical protein
MDGVFECRLCNQWNEMLGCTVTGMTLLLSEKDLHP